MGLGNRLRVLGLLCCDGAIAILCGLAAICIRFGEEAQTVLSEQRVWWRLLLLAGSTLIAFFLLDLYNLAARHLRRRRITSREGGEGIASRCEWRTHRERCLGRT